MAILNISSNIGYYKLHIISIEKRLIKNEETKADRRLKADKSNPLHLGSTIPGTVDKILVKEGDQISENDPLMTIEAMKMETTVVASMNGYVDKIYVNSGAQINAKDLLITFLPLEAGQE